MKARITTASVLIAVVLACSLATNPLPLKLLLALIGGLALYELARLANRSVVAPFAAIALLAGYWLFLDSVPVTVRATQLVALTVAGALWAPWWIRRKSSLLFEAGSLYVIAPLAAVAMTHELMAEEAATPFNLHSIILLVALPLWAGDTAGYLVGRTWGRRLLAPRVSPKKTVEGSIAYFFGSVIVGALLGSWVEVPVVWAAGVGAIAGIFGQLGDLYESSLKRLAGVKDSGTLLPGHGGVLDRIDSLLFAAPLQVLTLSLLLASRR